MEKILFLIVLFMAGLFGLWMAIFGKRREIKNFGSGIPADFADFFMMLLYRIFPSFIRRIFLFLLGLGLAVLAIYILLH